MFSLIFFVAPSFMLKSYWVVGVQCGGGGWGYVGGGLQDFSVSPSPLETNWVFKLIVFFGLKVWG